jgi:hypothetical protein
MSTLSLRLPDSLHEKIRELAARDDISINQFISTAVAEKMAALLTLDYLAKRAERGNRAAFEAVLRKVPTRRALTGDEWRAIEAQEPKKRSQPAKAARRRGARKSKK